MFTVAWGIAPGTQIVMYLFGQRPYSPHREYGRWPTDSVIPRIPGALPLATVTMVFGQKHFRKWLNFNTDAAGKEFSCKILIAKAWAVHCKPPRG
jgi:hypothetical protein